MVVSDAATGKIITSLPIGDRCDGVAFDPEKKRVYSSNGEGTITVVQQINKDSYKILETIPTQKGARTIAIDNMTHHLYLPAADYEAALSAGGRPAIKPNSFVVLDIETMK